MGEEEVSMDALVVKYSVGGLYCGFVSAFLTRLKALRVGVGRPWPHVQ